MKQSTTAVMLCSTTLARTWEPSLLSVLASRLVRALPPGWFVPQVSFPSAGAGPMAGGAVREWRLLRNADPIL
jgi:hypothetical protein